LERFSPFLSLHGILQPHIDAVFPFFVFLEISKTVHRINHSAFLSGYDIIVVAGNSRLNAHDTGKVVYLYNLNVFADISL
jgi:hypothetical protein